MTISSVMRLTEASDGRNDGVYGLDWLCMSIMVIVYGGFLVEQQVENGGRRFVQKDNEEEHLAFLVHGSSFEIGGFFNGWRWQQTQG